MGHYSKCTLILYAFFICSLFYIWKALRTPVNDYDDHLGEFAKTKLKSETKNEKPAAFKGQCRTEKDCCDRIIKNDSKAIEWSKNINQYENDGAILADLQDCDTFFRRRSYVWGPSSSYTTDESQFPLAFSIMVHLDLVHLERLLKLIYQPQNLYCIHVDKKSVNLTEKVEKLARCFPNVFVTKKSETVFWGGFGVLRGTVNCLEDLVNYENRTHGWEYYINLSAQDFPLKTNLEMVEILRTWGGGSNVEIVEENKPWKYKYHHEIQYNKFGNPETNVKTTQLKSSPPYNMTIYKGNLAAIMSRDLCDWIVSAKEPKQLLKWLSDTDVADEHFWPTLIKNKNKFTLPRYHQPSFTVVEPYLARYTIWKTNDDKKFCGGKFLHDVCIFGVADAHRLTKLSHFFANKFYLGYQSMAYKCLENWLKSKRQTEVYLVERQEAAWS